MLLDKKQLPLVAMEFMNDVHTEDIDIINQIFEQLLKYEQSKKSEDKEKLISLYKHWYEHTIEHFKGEEVMMEEKRFPPYPMHKGEHEYGLKRMDEVFNTWQETDDISTLKVYLIEELPKWLIHHIKTMDTVTAMFFKTGLSPCSAH